MLKLPPLFDANGQIGAGARSRPDFAACADLLAQMDRLGIARSLVWRSQARDQHPPTGNARLLEELTSLSEPQRRRLVPSLVICPAMMYEQGSVEGLIAQMKQGIRALRVFPVTLRHRLHHLAPLLEKLAEFNPVILLDIREVSNDQDLLELAGGFPQTPIICMHGMWPHLFNLSLLHVMSQRENVLIDLSWQHTGGTTEMIVRRLGAGRIVFATGWKAHNGASIGHLQNAGIDDSARAAIAHGNLDKLLGLAPTVEQPKAEDRLGPELWKNFRAGKLPPGQIIDAHAHLGAAGIWPREEASREAQAKTFVQIMDRLNIATTFISGQDALLGEPLPGNRLLEKTLEPYGDRFRGYFGFNALYADELAPHLEEFFRRPFWAGLKLLCDYWQVPVTDPRFGPAYAFAQAHRLPILLHTWEGPYDSPAMLAAVAPKYPGASFLLAHSGGGDVGRREAVELVKATSNVYLEFCGSFCSSIPYEDTLRQVGSDRVVFGTDALGHGTDWELARLLSLDLPADAILPVLGANMRRILSARK
jgi:hypothetical protein